MLEKRSRKELKEEENSFYGYQDKWLSNKEDKDSWDRMFIIVYKVMISSIKKKLKNIKRADIDELALDGTISILARYKKPKGYYIQYLLTVCRDMAFYQLYNEQREREDKELSYEDWIEFNYKGEK